MLTTAMRSTTGRSPDSALLLKSEIDVAEDLDAGRLERVLPNWDGGEAPIVALYPSAEHLPLETRLLLDELATQFD
jgi:DNA-binding transcriptional LysR family regulator